MAKLHDLFSGKGANTQRPLRVGEEIRHALSDVFIRGECRSPELFDVTITISEVRVAPDMKNATAYFMPLAGQNKDVLLQVLRDSAPEIRYLVSKKVKLRHTPRIHFSLDESFDEAQRIETLLAKPDVAKDLKKPTEE
ncbi:MAG: 30S ribosome-binding factor RbfA [Rickettsiales bacterium]|nr:30S ribosome-binding factor RbfA [Rickettsiales bacterium]